MGAQWAIMSKKWVVFCYIIIGIIMSTNIIIIIVIVNGVATYRCHWRRCGGGHRTLASALAEAPTTTEEL